MSSNLQAFCWMVGIGGCLILISWLDRPSKTAIKTALEAHERLIEQQDTEMKEFPRIFGSFVVVDTTREVDVIGCKFGEKTHPRKLRSTAISLSDLERAIGKPPDERKEGEDVGHNVLGTHTWTSGASSYYILEAHFFFCRNRPSCVEDSLISLTLKNGPNLAPQDETVWSDGFIGSSTCYPH